MFLVIDMKRLTTVMIVEYIESILGWDVYPKKVEGGYQFSSYSVTTQAKMARWNNPIIKVPSLSKIGLDVWASIFSDILKGNGIVSKRILSMDDFKMEIADGKMFSVQFKKRDSDEIRNMTARRGVRKGVKNDPGTNGAWNRKNLDRMHDILTVYDVNKLPDDKFVILDSDGKLVDNSQRGAFRRINLPGIISVKVHGRRYEYKNNIFIEV